MRERWCNQLDPSLRGPGGWTATEDAKLLHLYAEHCGRWSEIAERMEGRSPNHVIASLQKKFCARSDGAGAGQKPVEDYASVRAYCCDCVRG